MKIIDVNGFKIGGEECFIIADIGSNHQQDLSLAKESIDAAAEAGANAVKFQSIQLSELYLNPNEKISSLIKQLEFPEEWHQILKEYCNKRNVTFFSSPTYLKAVDLLEDIDVPLYKLASAQVGTFPQIVDKVASLHKPTIFSTGIATYSEIIKAVNIFQKYGNDQFIILHCNSIYPTPPEKVNLQLIQTYKKMFGNPVGFSDHTEGTHIAGAAVAMGAKVIEKHFTLDRNLNTPDSNSFASDPSEFKTLVAQIRAIEKANAVATDRTSLQEEELEFKNSITYRVIAASDIHENDEINANNILFLRNESGINAAHFYNLPELPKANQFIKKGSLIHFSNLKY